MFFCAADKKKVLSPESISQSGNNNKVFRVTVNDGNSTISRRKEAEARQRSAFLCDGTSPAPPPPPPLPNLKQSPQHAANEKSPYAPAVEHQLHQDSNEHSETWTKSKGKALAPLLREAAASSYTPTREFTKWPDFSPLSSPLEILSISSRPGY